MRRLLTVYRPVNITNITSIKPISAVIPLRNFSLSTGKNPSNIGDDLRSINDKLYDVKSHMNNIDKRLSKLDNIESLNEQNTKLIIDQIESLKKKLNESKTTGEYDYSDLTFWIGIIIIIYIIWRK